MRLLNLSLILLLCALYSTSCKKTTTNTVTKTVIDSVLFTPAVYPDYMVLKPGNYWIYQAYTVFSADSAVPASYPPDSFYVEKDTAIGSYTYHKLVKNISFQHTQQILYLRDSLSYVVGNGGGIFFSSQDSTTVFRTIQYSSPAAGVPDTIPVTYQMGLMQNLTTVPIGVFPTCTYRQIFHFTPAHPMEENDWKYAENIGLIVQTLGFYTNPSASWLEDRLIRYHVE